jgi:hypothetical protein
MKDVELNVLEGMVEDMLNNLYNSNLLVDDDDEKEFKCIIEMIGILRNRISYY